MRYIQTSSSKLKANYNVQVLKKVILCLFFTEKESIFPCTKLRNIFSQVPKGEQFNYGSRNLSKLVVNSPANYPLQYLPVFDPGA